MNLLNEYGIPTPASKAAKNPEEAYKIVKDAGLFACFWMSFQETRFVPDSFNPRNRKADGH